MKKNSQVVTFGCRLNSYESEVISSYLANSDLNENTVVINTCAVTAEAENKAVKYIKKIKKNNKNIKIIATGCATELSKEKFGNLAEIDHIVDNHDKLNPKLWGSSSNSDLLSSDDLLYHHSKTRAFIKIQSGCDHSCTFCIIPSTRGKNKSIPIKSLIKQVQNFVDHGYQEIVLTGVDITAYGDDLDANVNLGELVIRLLSEVTGLARLRLSSLDPKEIDDKLISCIGADARFLPHFHFSIQAGNNLILKRMKRRHLREDVIDIINIFRNKDARCSFGSDFITGFPTETDSFFADTVSLVKDLNITHLHVFPYSVRPNTPAARMPQVDKKLAKIRSRILINLGLDLLSKQIDSYINTKRSVLFESNNRGYCQNYIPVKLLLGEVMPGKIADVQIVNKQDGIMHGTLL